MSTYTIRVDDNDREYAPDEPWTARMLDENGEAMTDAGTGATPREAVRDLLRNARTETADDLSEAWA